MLGKILFCMLNVMTGGVWGVLRWFFGLFRAKDGKSTFMRAVLVYLVGHSFFLMLTGVISPWQIIQGGYRGMEMALTAGGYKVVPPDDDRTAIQRAQDAIDKRMKQIADAAAEQKKAADEQAAKIKAEGDAKLAEIERKFQRAADDRDLKHRMQLLAEQQEKLKREADAKAAELAAQAERIRLEAQRHKDETARKAAELAANAKREANERADKAIRDAQAAAEDTKRKASEMADKAKYAAETAAVFGALGDVVTTAERTFTKNLNSFFVTPPKRDPTKKIYACPTCKKRWWHPRGDTAFVQCPCGSLIHPHTLPEAD